MLSIQNLRKSFGGVQALENCSFKVGEGKITALIGPNGSGKTTLFNIVSGLLKADSGKVFFQGKNITNKKPERIARLGVSRLFQQSRLFENLAVEENLLLALNEDDEKFWKNALGLNNPGKEKHVKVKEILKTVGLENVGKKLSRDLSFGQKRLVELARAIAKPHSFLMLDEPIAGVNPKLRLEIAKALKSLKKQGQTILLIEHDMSFTLGIADFVIVLDDGRVIAEGVPSKIRKNPKVLEAYLGE